MKKDSFLSNFLPDFWFLKKVTCNPSTHRHTYHHHHHTSRTIYSRFGEVEMSFLSWWSATESAIHLAVSSQLSQTKNSEPWEGLKIQRGGKFYIFEEEGKVFILAKIWSGNRAPRRPPATSFSTALPLHMRDPGNPKKFVALKMCPIASIAVMWILHWIHQSFFQFAQNLNQ